MVKVVIYTFQSFLPKHRIEIDGEMPESFGEQEVYEFLKQSKKKYPKQVRGSYFNVLVNGRNFYIGRNATDLQTFKTMELKENEQGI